MSKHCSVFLHISCKHIPPMVIGVHHCSMHIWFLAKGVHLLQKWGPQQTVFSVCTAKISKISMVYKQHRTSNEWYPTTSNNIQWMYPTTSNEWYPTTSNERYPTTSNNILDSNVCMARGLEFWTEYCPIWLRGLLLLGVSLKFCCCWMCHWSFVVCWVSQYTVCCSQHRILSRTTGSPIHIQHCIQHVSHHIVHSSCYH